MRSRASRSSPTKAKCVYRRRTWLSPLSRTDARPARYSAALRTLLGSLRSLGYVTVFLRLGCAALCLLRRSLPLSRLWAFKGPARVAPGVWYQCDSYYHSLAHSTWHLASLATSTWSSSFQSLTLASRRTPRLKWSARLESRPRTRVPTFSYRSRIQ